MQISEAKYQKVRTIWIRAFSGEKSISPASNLKASVNYPFFDQEVPYTLIDYKICNLTLYQFTDIIVGDISIYPVH